MVEEGDNKEVVREDRGEIKVRKENGDALGTGMKELVNNVLVDKTGEDRHNKVKMCDIPLENWTVNGINAFSSRIGRTLIMDADTASICKLGVARLGFKRVFIPINKPLRRWSLAMFHICSRVFTFYNSERTGGGEYRKWYLQMRDCLEEKIHVVLKETGVFEKKNIDPANPLSLSDISNTRFSQTQEIDNVEEKMTRIRIPGLASIFQIDRIQKLRNFKDDPTQEYIRKRNFDDVSEDDDFQSSPWVKALEFMNDCEEIVGGCFGGIESYLKKEMDYVDEKSTRVIPGPAGRIHKLRNFKDDPTQEYTREHFDDMDDDYKCRPWVTALEFINDGGEIGGGCFGDIKSYIKNGKLEKVVAIITFCKPDVLGDMNVTLKDP
nr:hypothetical protein [Tanacetum cinerariifolium]